MQKWIGDVADRAVRTALQTLLAYLSAAQLINEADWRAALLATGFAVVFSLLTSLVGSPSFGEPYGLQLLERAVKTFAQNVLAGIGTAVMFDQVDWKTALSAAALAALYSIGMSVLTTRAGASETRGQVGLTMPPNRGAHLPEM